MLNGEKYVKLSVCKSNIKEKGSYYTRVCKKGRLTTDDLVNNVKEKTPCVDIHNFKMALEVFSEVLVERLEEGYDIDLLGLATIGLKGKGGVKVDEFLERRLENVFNKRDQKVKKEKLEEDVNEGDEKDLTSMLKKNVEFGVQFTLSSQVKKHIKKYVRPYAITVKTPKPKIESVETAYSYESGLNVIKIKGEALKLAGQAMELYIKTKDKIFQIPKDALLQNEPKTLMFLVNEPLNEGEVYRLGISTQYAKMGNRKTSIIRRCVKDFRFEKRIKEQNVS